MAPIIAGWKRYATVQPPIMLLQIADAMGGNILTDLIVYSLCTVTLGVNKTECSVLHQNSSSSEALRIKTEVQPEASLIVLSKLCIQNIFPAVFALLLGSWSDKYGRKPLLVFCYLGASLTFFLVTAMVYWEVTPWFLLIAFIPSALLGEISILFLVSVCYLSDISNDHDKAWQFAWFEALICVGMLVGFFVGPVIFHFYGYTCVFGIGTLLCILATSHVLFFVPETVDTKGASITWSSLCDVTLVTDVIKACIKKCDGVDRTKVWCCINALILVEVCLNGDTAIGFLFVSARLGWNVNEYSMYLESKLILGVIGTLVAVKVIGTYTDVPETIVAIVSLTLYLGGAIAKSFTWKPWHIYLVVFLDMFAGGFISIIRAILMKSVLLKDTGKIYSITMSLQTVAIFGSGFLYSLIYSHYMPPLYPAPVWLVSALLLLVSLILSVYVHSKVSKTDTVNRSE